MFCLVALVFSVSGDTAKTGSALLEVRLSPLDKMLRDFNATNLALQNVAKGIPKKTELFEPIIEIPSAPKPLDMMVPRNQNRTGVSIMYPRFCCQCQLKKNVTAGDPRVAKWSTTTDSTQTMHRIAKLEAMGVKSEEVNKFLKALETDAKAPTSGRKTSTSKRRSHKRSRR